MFYFRHTLMCLKNIITVDIREGLASIYLNVFLRTFVIYFKTKTKLWYF